MGNTAVSQRKHCDTERPKSADHLDKGDYHKQLIEELINTNYPAKRARSKSWKASSSGSAKPVTSGGNNGKFHVSKKNQSWKRPELYYPAMIPEPDYSDSEEENSPNSSPLKTTSNLQARQQRKAHKLNQKNNSSSAQHHNMTTTAGTNGSVQLNEDGLVIPKKLGNPCLTSQERQNLHKELMFNQKIGKSVLGQKSELQKVMEKFRDDQKKKELEGEKMNKRSSFEKRLEEQASKIKEIEEDASKKPEEVDQPEFLRVHARVRANTFPVDTES